MKTKLLALALLLGTTLSAQARIVEREAGFEKVAGGSGTNIGGGNSGSSAYLATWCKGQSSLLRNVKGRAALKLENSGDYNAANNILSNGMIDALKSGSSAQHSFLYKSLERGLTLSLQIGATHGGNSQRQAMIAYHVLSNYYTFMIETVANKLDIKGQIPYLNSTADKLNYHAALFEQNFVHYASAQLNWISQNLMNESVVHRKIFVAPIGDALTTLKIAQTLTEATALDLEESLWNYRFSCASGDLLALSETLKSYTNGNKEIFDDEKQAIQYLNSELKRIAYNLSQAESCL